MIKVEDLRVGSILQIEDQIITVGKIDEDFISWKYNIKDRSFWNPYISLKDERLKPIELTEEILLKCGFNYSSKLSDNDCMSYYLYDELEILWLGYLCLDINGSFIPLADTELKYLHQLQNVYYALCNEELNYER